MREIVVVSGKGGTGKTSLVASLAALAHAPVLADCDVDAADLHLILNPHVRRAEPFSGGKRARITAEKCSGCGKCFELCRFGAVKKEIGADRKESYTIDPLACEGCGVCAWFCPVKAVEFEDAVNGQWFVSDTRFGPMVHAKLGAGEENSGKLVTLVRKEARRIAKQSGSACIVVDGSPGIGCPVIASITGTSLVVVVTEPTFSGEHDLERVAALARQLQAPLAVCVNKSDINREIAARIEANARRKGMTFLGTIRYDKAVTEAQIAARPVVEYTSAPVADDIRRVWGAILKALDESDENGQVAETTM